MVPLWSIFRSGGRLRGAGSSVQKRCLLRTDRLWVEHCGLCLFLRVLVDHGSWERWRGL